MTASESIPRDGGWTADLNPAARLDRASLGRVSYVISVYNDMARLDDRQAGSVLLIGIEAFIPPSSPRSPGHTVRNVIRTLDSGACSVLSV